MIDFYDNFYDDFYDDFYMYEEIIVNGIYLGQIVCYSQTVIVERTTVRAS